MAERLIALIVVCMWVCVCEFKFATSTYKWLALRNVTGVLTPHPCPAHNWHLKYFVCTASYTYTAAFTHIMLSVSYIRININGLSLSAPALVLVPHIKSIKNYSHILSSSLAAAVRCPFSHDHRCIHERVRALIANSNFIILRAHASSFVKLNPNKKGTYLCIYTYD